MDRDPHSDSSGTGLVIAIIAVLLLLMVVGVVAVGGVWFASSSAQTEAMMAMQREALAREAAAMAERAAMATAAAAAEPGVTQSLTLKMNGDGDVFTDEAPISLADLKTQLEQLASEANSNAEVLIQVNERCTAASILEVIDICIAAGATNVRLAPLEKEIDSQALPLR